MAGITIGKLIFGKDDFFYGLELCLHKAGRTAYPVNEKTVHGCDVLLVSLFWFLDVYHFERFLRESGLRHRKNRPIIIAGGMQCTVTPRLIAEMVDYVFIGDGDDHLGAILDQIEAGEKPLCEHLITRESERIPPPAECNPSPFAQMQGTKRPILRIEIARGCKYRCQFCLLSGLKPYREVDTEAILQLLDMYPKCPVSLFAPERALHSGWKRIQEKILQQGRMDLGQDARLENIDTIEKHSVTFGLEGISYRLRKSISKPFKEDFILEKLGRFVTNAKRIAFVSIYFIADLPGEDQSDWDELRRLFERIESENWSRMLTLKPVLNPLSPKPFTKLADAVIHPFRPYGKIWKDFLRKGDAGQWGFRIVETMVWDCHLRVMDALVHRGGPKAYQVIQKIPSSILGKNVPTPMRKSLAMEIIKASEKAGIKPEIFGDLREN